ncbi:MAG: histone family protein [Methanosarcinaceae archaeon]|nr:histone family protein [Methanosarcinaceae archaeon]
MTIIPYAPVERLIRSAGAHRVSETAGIALAEILEQYGLEISTEAIKLAQHAKRKTVKAEDIKLALEML